GVDASSRSPTPAATPRVELMNLATGTNVGWADAASFEFSKGSAFLAVQKARPRAAGDTVAGAAGGRGGGRGAGGAAGDPANTVGVDLILHDLKSGTDRLIGSVSEHSFNKAGTLLAWTVNTADEVGNGLYVVELASGVDRVLENAREHYSRMTWSDDGTAIAALRGNDADTLAQRENTL